jgi:ferredoxin-NADP reductase
VAKGNFYLYHSEGSDKLGQFSVIAPNKTPAENVYEVGRDTARFNGVLKQELKVGDEVAVQPGPRKLAYRGQYLPVTEMVYIACGVGIVPVLEQVRAVLPNGSSSVENVSVIWVNDDTKDFDVTAEQLEKEYLKYSTKLAVSCIVENLRKNGIERNEEIITAIPDFRPGVMAVIAGPDQVAEKARAYLMEQGYPEDCICTL